jgi:hypothetical protein
MGRGRRTPARTRAATGYAAVLGSAALAAVTVLTAAGCTPAAATASTATGSNDHSLTFAQAEAAYGSYVTDSEADAVQGNALQGEKHVGYAQWYILHSQYTALATAHTPVPTYRYGRPVFYVPALAEWPHWFMVAVPRAAVVNGRPGAAVNTLMVFEEYDSKLPWTLDGSAELSQRLPAIARDQDGYAINIRTDDPDLLLRPDVLGATQAAVVDEGPTSAAAAVVGSGPLTTGMYAAQNAQAGAATAQGLIYQWLLEGPGFPQFELRTADGGALVMYSMSLDTTISHPGVLSGSPIPVPAGVVPLLGAATEIGFHQVLADWTYEYAAVDPPATAQNAKVQIIGAYGGPTFGHAY